LACNSSIAIIGYLILTIFASIYGFREDWAWNPPLCIFRAYCYIVVIGAVCHSFSIQSLSRLFFTVYYTNPSLLSWRVHWIMIFINWLISFLIPIVPLFNYGSLGLEKESRGCVLRSQAFLASIYCTIMVIILPLNVTCLVYARIFSYSRQSTDRVLRSAPNMNNRTVRLNVKRELKFVQQLCIHTTCAGCGGIIFLFNVFWQGLSEIPLPKPMFLLGYNLMTMGMSLMTIAHFMLNVKVKRMTLRLLRRCC
jgi:hypothetical protein